LPATPAAALESPHRPTASSVVDFVIPLPTDLAKIADPDKLSGCTDLIRSPAASAPRADQDLDGLSGRTDLNLSYMEVAVTGTTFRTLISHTFRSLNRTTQRPVRRFAGRGRFAALGLTAALGLSVLGGCADMMQTPGQARNKGVQLYNQGKFTEAAGAFGTATRKDPRDYQSYYYLGRSYAQMKQYLQAIGTYRTALDVMKNHLKGKEDWETRAKVLDALAAAIAESGDPAAEAAQRVRADGVGPAAVEEKFVLAKVLQKQGDVDNAIQMFAAAAFADTNNFVVAREFGLFLMEIGQAERAAQELKRAWVINHKASRPEDEQVATALRKLDIVPGPSLLEEEDLAQPSIPRGPIPEVDVSQIGFGQQGSDAKPAPAAPTTPARTPAPRASVPRD
jgi:tetratricopeptide (TPR) repeat protein